jgi:hypothetical protein
MRGMFPSKRPLVPVLSLPAHLLLVFDHPLAIGRNASQVRSDCVPALWNFAANPIARVHYTEQMCEALESPPACCPSETPLLQSIYKADCPLNRRGSRCCTQRGTLHVYTRDQCSKVHARVADNP